MSAASEPGSAFARVIAALDASCHDAAALTTAVEVAARLDVEVTGLFIEDVNLIRLAALPMVRHIAIGSAAAAPFNVEQLEADLRTLAARAAAELESAAARQGVKWSFRVVRGLPAAELTTATMTYDLLVVGATRALAGVPSRLGSPLQAAVRRAGRSILHVPRRMTLTRPLIVLSTGSKLTLRTLAAATHLVGAATREFAVLLAGVPTGTARAADQIAAALAAQGYRSRIRQVGELTTAQLTRAVRESGSDVLIVAADLPGVEEDAALEDLMAGAPCPILIVR
jgi:hypothetical protein